MEQSRWVSLDRYGLTAGFKVLGGSLFPVIEGDANALNAARSIIEKLGFKRLAEGSYAIGWKSLPTMDSWAEAFPAAKFQSLSAMAPDVALNDEARTQMVEKGLVAESAFAERDAEYDNSQNEATVAPEAESVAAGSPSAAREWAWLDMQAYGLDVVVRQAASESAVRVEGPNAAKHLVRRQIEQAGGNVTEQNGHLTMTIPGAGGFDIGRLQEQLPMSKVSNVPVADVVVRGESMPEVEKLDLSARIDRRHFSEKAKEHYLGGEGQFTQEGLVEMAASSIGVSPSLMRAEFGINDRILQEQLESTLGEIFATEAPERQRSESLVFYGAELDKLLPREKASTGNSRNLQQFSTPLSVSAAMQSVLGLNRDMSVWEPTAGNGSLVALADPAKVHGMELDPERVKNLQSKGMVGVRNGDAVHGDLGDEKYPRVIMNPPFGSFSSGGGPRVFKTDVPGPNGGTPPSFRTGAQDKFIALRHLDKLAKNGVGALILGADSPMAYKSGEYSEETANFLNFLGDTHNILSVNYVEGRLYSSHGAGWPLLVVVTGDKRDELGEYAIPDTLPVISSLAELDDFSRKMRSKVLDYEKTREVPGMDNEAGGPSGVNREGETAEWAETEPGGKTEDSVANEEAEPESPETEPDTEQVEPSEGDNEADGAELEDDDTRQRHAVDVEEREIAYTPRSQMATLDKRVPANLGAPIENALDRVERANGDIDLFVSKALGWSLEDLDNALAAEQVDAVALALYQAQQGKGFILGDSTGVGKGRVVAALAAWGIRNGHKPIFCTSKSDLFGDIMRDFEDIGEADLIKPFILNNISKDIKKEKSGEVVVKRTPRSAVSKAMKEGGIPEGYNAVFMTYSQINREVGTSRKAQWLRRAADGNVLLFDEIHNASGPDSNTGANVRDAVRMAQFTLGSTATYAKRPDNLGLYEFTSMFEGNDPESVIESVTRGGPEYQEVLSTMLAESGQFISRGHEAPPPPQAVVVNPEYPEGYDSLEFSDRLARVLDAMTAVAEQGESIVNSENKEIQEQIKNLPKNVQAEMSHWKSQSVHFGSQMHHIVRVANYAAKADAIVDEVVGAVKEGRRPLVAVEGTMEAFLRGAFEDAVEGREAEREAEAETLGVDISEVPVDSSPFSARLTYRDTLESFLNKMLTIKRTDRYGNESSEKIVDVDDYMLAFERDQEGNLSDDPGLEDTINIRAMGGELDEDQCKTLLCYFSVLELIKNLPDSLPASPIDYVRAKVESHGIKMGELTGRKLGLKYDTENGVPEFYHRDDKDLNRRLQADQFNNGDVQCILLNAAAAEGVSLHAHKDFQNNEDRRTLFWQVPGDINVYTQMSGRTHRSGSREGVQPDFRVVCLDTPTEDRTMANLEQKEGRLKANTKADRETGIAMRSEPMMNKVGDFVTWEVLKGHLKSESISKKLGIDLDAELESFSETGVKEKTGTDTGLFSKMTGRLCRMVLAESRPLLEQLEEAFRERIEHLDRLGINPLKTQIHDLRATLVEKRELFPRSGPSAFESEVVAQQVSYTDYIKPISHSDLEKQLQKTMAQLEGRGLTAYPMKDLRSEIDSHQASRTIREIEHNIPDLYASLEGNTDSKLNQVREMVRKQPYRIPANEQVVDRLKKIVSQEDRMNRLSELLGVGVEIKNVPASDILLDCDVASSDMVVSRILAPALGGNPSLPGKWNVRLESPDAEVGKFDLSLNQLMYLMQENPTMKMDNEPLEAGDIKERFNEDRQPRTLQRERWVVMGNLPKGYSMTASNPDFSRGKPGVFTAEDGRKLRGIIMPRDFDASDLRRLMDSDFTMSTLEAINAYIDRKESESYHPVILTEPAKQMEKWAKKENKVFNPGRGAVLLKDKDTQEWKIQISSVKKNAKNFTQDSYLLNMLAGDFATTGLSKTQEAIISAGRVEDVVERLVKGHSQTFHGDGKDADWYRGFMRERGTRLIQEQELAEQAGAEKLAPGETAPESVPRLDGYPQQGFQLGVG